MKRTIFRILMINTIIGCAVMSGVCYAKSENGADLMLLGMALCFAFIAWLLSVLWENSASR